MTVLIVRPEGKCQQTCAYFSAQRLACEGLPLMALQAIEPNLAQMHANLVALRAGDWIISTSTFASELMLDWFNKLNDKKAFLGQKLIWFAIGQKSAQILMPESHPPFGKVNFPKQETSEGLLKYLANFPTYQIKETLFPEKKPKIIILKGEGGRTLLKDSLVAWGHQVMESDLYQRKIMEPAMLSKSWYQSHISCVVVTSGELLQATFQYFDDDNQWLTTLPWVVVSERMANIAKDYGINTVFVSGGANNAALLATASVASASRH